MGPHCSYSTKHGSNLTKHIRTHTGERPFICSFDSCGKRFTTKTGLNEHIKRHIGDKRHKCPYCNKAFVSSSNLKGHIRTHTGEKPFECKHCEMKFSHNNSLRTHIRNIHTKEPQVKSFVCSFGHCK